MAVKSPSSGESRRDPVSRGTKEAAKSGTVVGGKKQGRRRPRALGPEKKEGKLSEKRVRHHLEERASHGGHDPNRKDWRRESKEEPRKSCIGRTASPHPKSSSAFNRGVQRGDGEQQNLHASSTTVSRGDLQSLQKRASRLESNGENQRKRKSLPRGAPNKTQVEGSDHGGDPAAWQTVRGEGERAATSGKPRRARKLRQKGGASTEVCRGKVET